MPFCFGRLSSIAPLAMPLPLVEAAASAASASSISASAAAVAAGAPLLLLLLLLGAPRNPLPRLPAAGRSRPPPRGRAGCPSAARGQRSAESAPWCAARSRHSGRSRAHRAQQGSTSGMPHSCSLACRRPRWLPATPQAVSFPSPSLYLPRHTPHNHAPPLPRLTSTSISPTTYSVALAGK